MRKRLAFTLLEVMVAISIMLIAAGAIGWKMFRMIERKRFSSGAEKLRSRLFTCRQLALNMQADWEGVLRRDGKKWTFEAKCVDSPEVAGLPPLVLDILIFSLDGEKKELLSFYFTATGEIYPKGVLLIRQSATDPEAPRIEWKFPEIFLKEEGDKLGPLHPADLKK